MDFVLNEGQLFIIAMIASVLVQLIRFIGERLGKPVGKVFIQWAVFAISLGLGVWWGVFDFPAFPGFGGPESLAGILQFLAAVVALIGQVLGVAYVIYNVLLKKVFDAIQPLRI